MARDHSDLLGLSETLTAAEADERIRLGMQRQYQELVDAKAAVRNGTPPRTLATTAGDLQLRISELRAGSLGSARLGRRSRIDQALFAVVMQAYGHGVSTRKVDDLVAVLRVASGTSKSEVSWICSDLDEEVVSFQERNLDAHAYSYVFLDAT